MKIREVCERVQNAYSKGVASDDTRLSYRAIYNKLVTARAELLKQRLNKGARLSDRNLEFLECVALEKAEPYDCPCAPPSGCTILKSKCKLPRPVTSQRGDYVTSVTSIDGTTVYDKTTWEAKKSKQYNKWTGKEPDYFWKNDYLYITSPSLLKAVTVVGVFEDITGFSCSFCDECEDDTIPADCSSPLDDEFKVEASLIDTIVQMAVGEFIGIWSRRIKDERNDAREDEPTQEQK